MGSHPVVLHSDIHHSRSRLYEVNEFNYSSASDLVAVLLPITPSNHACIKPPVVGPPHVEKACLFGDLKKKHRMLAIRLHASRHEHPLDHSHRLSARQRTAPYRVSVQGAAAQQSSSISGRTTNHMFDAPSAQLCCPAHRRASSLRR
jgi:hypothetical protein